MNSSKPSVASLSQLNTPLSGANNMAAAGRRPVETNPLGVSGPSQAAAGNLNSASSPPGARQQAPSSIAPAPNSQAHVSSSAASGNSSAADVVDYLVKEFVTKCRVSPVDTTVAPVNATGLSQVAQLGDWSAVVELSSKLVVPEDYSRGVQEELSLLLQLRFEAFFQLKSFDDLSVEISNVLMHLDIASKEASSQDSRLKMYSKAVSLSALLCEIKAMTGRGAEALEQLYRMKTELMLLCRRGKSNKDADYLTYFWWYTRLWNLIVNVLLRQRQFQLALQELSSMLLEIRAQRQELDPADSANMIWKAEIVLLCRIVRLLLQVGAVTEAKKFAAEAQLLLSSNVPPSVEAYVDMSSTFSDESVVRGHVELTEGLLAHVECRYEDAVAVFERVLSRYRAANKKLAIPVGSGGGGAATEPAGLPPQLRGSAQHVSGLLSQLRLGSPVRPGTVETVVWNSCFAALEAEGGLYAAATNSMATSLLFLRRIEESIALLEALIQSGPSKYMTDAVVFNLCTMYDLSCAHELSGCKKRMLQGVASMYRICNLNWKSFRL